MPALMTAFAAGRSAGPIRWGQQIRTDPDAVAGFIAFMPGDGNAQAPPVVNQGPGSAFSYGQQGGITAGTLNIAPGRFSRCALMRPIDIAGHALLRRLLMMRP
jgi:hypothetical protein